MALAQEVIFDHVITFLLARGAAVITCQSRRLHEVLERVEILAEIVAPPGFRRCKIVEIVAPFAKLDRSENPRQVHGGQRRFIVVPHRAASAFDLHVSPRITHHWPADGGEIIEDRLGTWLRAGPGIKPITQMLILHHLDELLERFELTRRAVDRKHARRLTRQRLDLEARGNWPGESNLARNGADGGGAGAQPQEQAERPDATN